MENLTGVSMREHANFIHALSTRTASRNSSNFQSHLYLFSVGFMKGGKESKELCSVSGLGLRLHGRFSRNFVYCCMRVYLRRVLAVADREEKSSASTILTRETSYAYFLCHQRKDYIYMRVCSFLPSLSVFIGRNRLG